MSTTSDTKQQSSLPAALCLMGPTASGKTRVAIELIKHHPFEIISVDSALVYRGLDIGSGKPDADTLKLAPHRLVDIRDPSEAYSVAEFREDVTQAMGEIHRAGKIPLLVGGTMLYFKALRDGLATMPAANPEIRQKILEQGEKNGWATVHKRLAEVDPESAQRIHPNDPQRLQRALEIYEITGKSMTQFHKEEKLNRKSTSSLPFNLHYTAIVPTDRAVLHQQIETRFHQMLNDGLLEEVRQLKSRDDLHASLPALRSVGYRQVWEYLNGDYDYDTMVEKALAATRQLAKRQLTWLRSWPDLTELDNKDEKIISQCLKLIAPNPI